MNNDPDACADNKTLLSINVPNFLFKFTNLSKIIIAQNKTIRSQINYKFKASYKVLIIRAHKLYPSK